MAVLRIQLLKLGVRGSLTGRATQEIDTAKERMYQKVGLREANFYRMCPALSTGDRDKQSGH